MKNQKIYASESRKAKKNISKQRKEITNKGKEKDKERKQKKKEVSYFRDPRRTVTSKIKNTTDTIFRDEFSLSHSECVIESALLSM